MNELKSMNTFIYQAGLPNAGPMAAEDCLATNIRKNKVSIFLTFSGDFNCPPPAGEGARRLRAGVAERGEASVPCNQQAILLGLYSLLLPGVGLRMRFFDGFTLKALQ